MEYDEIVELAKMDEEMRDEIHQHNGYRKILDSCKQAKKDGYEWLWVDTCCIDKRSSAELSEAINSVYRWYENAQVCYVYLHDVLDSLFPVVRNHGRHANSWLEWFSCGWMLQEMIVPRNVWFFNTEWQAIGDKRTLAPSISALTLLSPTPTVVGEGCVGQKRPVPANGPAGMDLTQYGKVM